MLEERNTPRLKRPPSNLKIFFQSPRNNLFILMSLLGAISWLYLLDISLNLRPISDDYCTASTARSGLFGSVVWSYMNWSGSYILSGLGALLVGLPILFFPFQIASGFTFIFTLALLSITSIFLVKAGRKPKFRERGFAWQANTLLICFVPLAWISFWWFGIDESTYSAGLMAARSLVHWQLINAVYVVTALTGVLLVVFIIRCQEKNWPWFVKFGLSLFVGLWFGGSGFPVATTVIFLLALLAIVSKTKIGALLGKPRRLLLSGVSSGATAGLLLDYFSPGSQARKAILDEYAFIKDLDPAKFLNWVFPGGLIDFFNIYWTWGTAAVGALGIIAGTMFDKQIKSSANTFLIWSGSGVILSFLLAHVVRASEAFSYSAYWHLTTPAIFAFFSMLFFGIFVAMKLKEKKSQILTPTLAAALVLFVSAASVTLTSVLTDSETRLMAWGQGPSNLVGLGDIESPYILKCWQEISEFRETPNRNSN